MIFTRVIALFSVKLHNLACYERVLHANCVSKSWKMCSYICDLFENCYFHCLHYLVNKTLYWFEKVFWACCIVVSLTGVAFVVTESINNYYSVKASIRIRTDYLNFNVYYPAIFICERKDMEGKMAQTLQSVSDKQSLIEIKNFIRLVSFVKPLEGSTIQPTECGGANEYCNFIETYKNNLSIFQKYVRATCEEMFTSCMYNNVKFNCCHEFLPIDTYEGKCYAINSLNLLQIVPVKLRKTIKRNNVTKTNNLLHSVKVLGHSPIQKNPGNLSIELAHYSEVSVWFLGNVDVPSKTNMKQNNLAIKASEPQILQVTDVYLRLEVIISETKSMIKVKPENRDCGLGILNKTKTSYKYYSKSSCEIECIRAAQLRYCGCALHVLPPKKDFDEKLICNLTGLMCVMNGQKDIISHHVISDCGCINNCGAYEVFLIGTVPSYKAESKFLTGRNPASKKRINFIVNAPTAVYVRYTKQEALDFIVSIGGTISLFIGCSFLTLAQIFYYLIVKPNITQKNQNPKEKLFYQKRKQSSYTILFKN